MPREPAVHQWNYFFCNAYSKRRINHNKVEVSTAKLNFKGTVVGKLLCCSLCLQIIGCLMCLPALKCGIK